MANEIERMIEIVKTEWVRWRVIEAAPELYEAAIAVEEWWLREGMHEFNGAPACMFRIRSALTKARGESE